jgi:hypothetical protein
VKILGFVAVLLLGGRCFAQEESAFSPLHIYYISPTGNDNNLGTLPSSAWASPLHNVDCGDVIIVEAGSYTAGKYGGVFGSKRWGTVSNCPSTRGGIDGTGGIYFAILLCAGPYISSCAVSGGANEAFRVDQSNWAVEGFTATQNDNGNGACYSATSENTTTMHHIAFINDIANSCDLAGFDSYSWTAPGGGADQTAVVGAISYNGAQSISRWCGSGISIIPADGPDTSSGTHVFVAGYFGYKNVNAPSGAGCNTDGEGLVFDSWSCMKYKYQGVAEQNVWWLNGNSGFEVFPNCPNNGDKVRVFVFHNTSYGNEQDPKHRDVGADAFLNQVLPTSPGSSIYSIYDNIFVTTEVTSGKNGQTPVYAAGFYLNNNNTQLVVAERNYFWQSNPGEVKTAGNPNTDVYVNGSRNRTSFPFGANEYTDPKLANPGGLPSTAPNCVYFTNTTACMNEGYRVAANLTPSGGAVGHGYQPPGPCAPDPYFPIWLKGVVYLHWNVSNLTENGGLITKPCNM